jgi:hypothetical protein
MSLVALHAKRARVRYFEREWPDGVETMINAAEAALSW